MTIQAVGWVLDHSKATSNERLVLISIANHLNKDLDAAWLSYQTMAEEAGISRREAIRSCKALVVLGELSIERGAGPKSTTGSPLNIYRLPLMVTTGHPSTQPKGDRKSDQRAPQRVTTPSPEPRSNHSNPSSKTRFQELSVEEQAAILGAQL